jgi:hypothetical protein
MIKAGEAGGALEVILQRLADFMERAEALETQGQGRDDLSDRGHLGGRRHLDVHHVEDRARVRQDVRGIRIGIAGRDRVAGGHQRIRRPSAGS